MHEIFSLEETEINIRGESEPAYGKTHFYTIEVNGKLYNNGKSFLTIYVKGDEYKGGVTEDITLQEGSNSYRLKLLEEYFGDTVFHPYTIGTTYVIEVTNLIYTGTFEFTPQPKPEVEFVVPESVKQELETRGITIIDWIEGKLAERWYTTLKICAGKTGITNPTIIVESDIETVQKTLSKAISAKSCAKQQFQVKAIDPNTIKASFVEFTKQTKDILQTKPNVPDWIRNNAKWWAEGQIDDSDFVSGIQHLIKEKIINIPDLPEQASETTEEKVPDWIRNNAGWWADGLISDDDFVSGIKYLVEQGIIRV